MRKSSLLTTLALVVSASSASAQGDLPPWYIDLSFGAAFQTPPDPPGAPEVDYDTGLITSLGVGRYLVRGGWDWAIEGEAYYSNVKLAERDRGFFPSTTEDHASATALMANLVTDIDLTEGLALYLGAGVGYATDISFDTFDSGNLNQIDSDGVAAQFKVGFRYALGGSYDFGIGYRYFATEDVEVEDLTTLSTSDVEFSQHALEVNFRWGL